MRRRPSGNAVPARGYCWLPWACVREQAHRELTPATRVADTVFLAPLPARRRRCRHFSAGSDIWVTGAAATAKAGLPGMAVPPRSAGRLGPPAPADEKPDRQPMSLWHARRNVAALADTAVDLEERHVAAASRNRFGVAELRVAGSAAPGHTVSACALARHRPSQDLDFATSDGTPLPEIAGHVMEAFRAAGYGVRLVEATGISRIHGRRNLNTCVIAVPARGRRSRRPQASGSLDWEASSRSR
jgi:hypothetical protein